MVAKKQFDVGISINPNSQFNYSGMSLDEITPDMARGLLNFRIEKRPCYTEDGQVLSTMNYLRRIEADGTASAVVDTDVSVGDRFDITSQPLEVLQIAEYLMSKIQGIKIDTVATMYNCGTTFITLSYGDKWIVKGDTSPHWTNIILNNPLTKGLFHMVQATTRVVCENTLRKGCKEGEGFRFRHTIGSRALIENALISMQTELEQAKTTREACEFLASRSITDEEVKSLLTAIYPNKEKESERAKTIISNKRTEVLRQFEGDSSFTEKTFYAFLNANTYISEHPTHQRKDTDGVQVAFDNITGRKANFKSSVLEACLAVANGHAPVPVIGGGDDDAIDVEYTMVA